MNSNNPQLLRESYRDAVLMNTDGTVVARGDTTLFYRTRSGTFRASSVEQEDSTSTLSSVKILRLPGGSDVEIVRRSNANASNNGLQFDFFYRNDE